MSEHMTESSGTSTRRGGRGVTGAIILIAIGVIFLLSNMGKLTIDWWYLLQFWPVFLILIGLDLLLGRRSALGSLLAAVIGLAVVGGLIYLAATRAPQLSADAVTREISQPIGAVSRLDVELNLGAGETRVSALDSGDRVAGTYRTDSALEIEVAYETHGDKGEMVISQKGEARVGGWPFGPGSHYIGELDLGLPSGVPIDLVVEAGAGETTLDLSDLTLRSLTVSAGVGSVTVILPEDGSFEMSVEAGVGSVNIELPDALEAQVNWEGGLTSFNVNNSRLKKIEEGVWETDGFRGAADRVEMSLSAGVGAVTIR